MEDDTRQPNSPPSPETPPEPEYTRPRRPKPKHDFPKTQASKLWEAFGNPEEPANSMPGGTYNSAGGRPPEVTWRDAFRNPFATKDGRRFYQLPCAKDSLLVGIGAGGAVGGIRFIATGLTAMLVTTNWAVGTFAVSTIGMYQWCQYRRREEGRGMVAAVKGMQLLNEKKAKERAIAEAAEKAAEEERQRNKSWWKVWQS